MVIHGTSGGSIAYSPDMRANFLFFINENFDDADFVPPARRQRLGWGEGIEGEWRVAVGNLFRSEPDSVTAARNPSGDRDSSPIPFLGKAQIPGLAFLTTASGMRLVRAQFEV